jgi:hypothetical protein
MNEKAGLPNIKKQAFLDLMERLGSNPGWHIRHLRGAFHDGAKRVCCIPADLDFVLEHAKVLAEIHERSPFVGELEPRPPDRPLVVATARDLIDRYFLKGRGLLAGEVAEVEDGITRRRGPHVVLHICEAQQGKLPHHSVLANFITFPNGFLPCLDRLSNLDIA